MTWERQLLTMITTILTLVGCLLGVVIWLILQWRVLSYTHADDLTWLLFWIYVPVSISTNLFAQFISKMTKEN